MNTKTKKPLPAWLPLVVGAAFVALFITLGAWQISRGLEKRAGEAAFSSETGFSAWQDGMETRPFQRLKATGRFDAERQLLLENIIVDSRNGYYVITPLATAAAEPLLLVNRGWIRKSADGPPGPAALELPPGRITVRGRAGRLPRSGFKMGEAFGPGSSWPRTAVYPDYAEVGAALGRPVQPFVLLMDSEDPNGFHRQWAPSGFGPGKHFGYALQWFAMAAVLLGLLVWNHRKKRFGK